MNSRQKLKRFKKQLYKGYCDNIQLFNSEFKVLSYRKWLREVNNVKFPWTNGSQQNKLRSDPEPHNRG